MELRPCASAHSRPAEGQGRWRTARPPGQLRLIGSTAMFDAIRKAWIYLLTAEMEIGFAGMSHWPFAEFIGQIEQAGLIRNLRAGLCRNQTTGWSRVDRRLLLVWSVSQKPTRAHCNDAGLGRGWSGGDSGVGRSVSQRG